MSQSENEVWVKLEPEGIEALLKPHEKGAWDGGEVAYAACDALHAALSSPPVPEGDYEIHICPRCGKQNGGKGSFSECHHDGEFVPPEVVRVVPAPPEGEGRHTLDIGSLHFEDYVHEGDTVETPRGEFIVIRIRGEWALRTLTNSERRGRVDVALKSSQQRSPE